VARKKKSSHQPNTVSSFTHRGAVRKNIPTSEFEPLLQEKDKSTLHKAYKYRNKDLDPQLVWSSKEEQDDDGLYVHAPPLYIQEKVQPKALIEDLQLESRARSAGDDPYAVDLFSDFNGVLHSEAKTEFYQHDQNWSNRLILGDSLQVMVSLAEREGLQGKVQCIYLDPPYGIKFNSNFQWSTTSRTVTDGKIEHISREPEQVKAFRDTWRKGIHSCLS